MSDQIIRVQNVPLRELPFDATPLLNEALAKAQGMMTNASKDANNPHFKSRYATLASSFEACREALASNGLSIIQNPETLQDGAKVWAVKCVSELRHASGERMVSSAIVIPVASPGGAQQIGSALSYARRYQMQSLIGIAQADDDDDGNAAQLVVKPTPADIAKRNHEYAARANKEIAESFAVDKPVGRVENPQNPRPKLTELRALAEGYGLTDEMPGLIKKVLGTAKKGADLSDNDIQKIINYINLTQTKP